MDNPQPARIVITNVNPKIVEELNNISINEGIPLSKLLKPALKDFVDSYPDEMKKRKS